MFKRIIFYCVIALIVFAGGQALCQDTAVIAISIDVPAVPMELICDTDAANWTLTAAGYLTKHDEDGGTLFRLMKVYPGNEGLTVGLSYTRTALVGPSPGRTDLIYIEATPAGFMDSLSGWLNRVDAGVISPQILITDPSECYWHLGFSFIEGFSVGTYTSTLTWTLAVV